MFYRLVVKECEMIMNLSHVRAITCKGSTISFNYILPFNFFRESCYVNDNYKYDTEAAAKKTFQDIEAFIQQQQKQKPLA